MRIVIATVVLALMSVSGATQVRVADGVPVGIAVDSKANVGIGTTTPKAKLDVAGTLHALDSQLKNTTIQGQLHNTGMPKGKWDGWDYALVSRDGNYTLATYGSSSSRYKSDIVPLDDDFRKVFKLRAKAFRYNESGEKAFGFIAEDVHEAGLSNLVVYDSQQKPDTIIHFGLPFYLLEAMKLLQQDIKSQQDEITALKQQIARLHGKR